MAAGVLAKIGDRRARLVLGVLVGGLTGGVLFWASRLGGLGLFVLAGAAAGAMGAVAVQFYGHSYELQDVTLSVPQLSELRFVVNRDSRLVAWRLFVESGTRVSTQPLADDAGSLREALSSLYGLFQAVRETLKSSAPSRATSAGPTVEQLAMAMLNLELRPFLSLWHPRLKEWELANPGQPERAWSGNVECRQALAVLQQNVYQYALGFAALANAGNAEALLRVYQPTAEVEG